MNFSLRNARIETLDIVRGDSKPLESRGGEKKQKQKVPCGRQAPEKRDAGAAAVARTGRPAGAFKMSQISAF